MPVLVLTGVLLMFTLVLALLETKPPVSCKMSMTLRDIKS